MRERGGRERGDKEKEGVIQRKIWRPGERETGREVNGGIGNERDRERERERDSEREGDVREVWRQE